MFFFVYMSYTVLQSGLPETLPPGKVKHNNIIPFTTEFGARIKNQN